MKFKRGQTVRSTMDSGLGVETLVLQNKLAMSRLTDTVWIAYTLGGVRVSITEGEICCVPIPKQILDS